jgi:uncharacterized protein
MFPVLVYGHYPSLCIHCHRWNIRLNLIVQEENVMSHTSYRLMEYHQRLDTQLREELRRRLPDVLRIQKLKKLKLVVKDRLSRLAQGMTRKHAAV